MHVLIAIDGAPHNDSALRVGGSIAVVTGGSVTLLTVITSECHRPHGEAVLGRAVTLLPTCIRAETRIRVGRPSEQIMRELTCLKREGTRLLLVLGEHAPQRLAKRVLAPTADQVLQKMPCPLLVARGQPRSLKRFLVCESGRDPSLLQRLLVQFKPLLASADTLVVLHVMSQIAAAPGVSGWELGADAEELIAGQAPEGELLAKDLEQLRQLPAHLEARVRHGLVVKEILTEARSGDYDLVVIGAHQGESWERYLLDDLAEEIVSHADRSVLII